MTDGTAPPGPVVGVDVGGTFTDLFLLDPGARAFRVAKVPSRRGDEAEGFMAGLRALGGPAGFAAVVHGTTVGTNALLERKGARLGVVTTEGFRDVLEMRRRDRPRTWGLWGEFRPVAERALRLEVPERTLADGTIRTPVDLDAVREATRALLAGGAEAVAVVFVNAYADPANERAAAEAVRALWPEPAHVTASHEILPEIREFERASTAALNASLQPVVGGYLARLEAALADAAYAGRFHVVASNGGVMSTAEARRAPIRTALSGPAAGVIAAAAVARAAGFEDVITGDLGGTSFDVSLVLGGAMSLAAGATLDFGLVVRSPMVEIETIGAGGGSLARVDAGGLLQVGPESAGSRPGPACYGGGNTRPTLTDANLVLGRINADRPIGGLVRLDADAAREALAEHVGRPLGLDPHRAAEAVVRVANARMAAAIRLVSVERGHDPARFALLPFGGGGALHVGALLRDCGLRAALVPRFPGVTSALGCVLADVRADRVRTLNLALDGLDAPALDARMAEEARAARAVVDAAGLAVGRVDTLFELDMLYLGQTHAVSVPLPLAFDGTTTGVTEPAIRAAFEAAYARAFSRPLDGLPARIVTLRVAAVGRRPPFDLSVLAPTATTMPEATARPVWFDGGWRDTAILPRLDLPVGARVRGPAILEQPDATTVVDPGLAARVDALGNLIVERDAP